MRASPRPPSRLACDSRASDSRQCFLPLKSGATPAPAGTQYEADARSLTPGPDPRAPPRPSAYMRVIRASVFFHLFGGYCTRHGQRSWCASRGTGSQFVRDGESLTDGTAFVSGVVSHRKYNAKPIGISRTFIGNIFGATMQPNSDRRPTVWGLIFGLDEVTAPGRFRFATSLPSVAPQGRRQAPYINNMRVFLTSPRHRGYRATPKIPIRCVTVAAPLTLFSFLVPLH
ncbi:hypothetical protein FB451DRAFT_125754 [Mycena latifolia]|nr:hypothetical protein FB451DRAFT_125754 [Mycena latifolia]